MKTDVSYIRTDGQAQVAPAEVARISSKHPLWLPAILGLFKGLFKQTQALDTQKQSSFLVTPVDGAVE
jgi:hypothetical protein